MQEEKNNDFPDVEREGWDPEKLAEEGSQILPDEVTRELLRGDETKGDPDERDVVGGIPSGETPHGYREIKHQTGMEE